MYPEKFQESIRKVEALRAENAALEPVRMTAKEKEELLAAYHPDYREHEFENLKIGPNAGSWLICFRRTPGSTRVMWIWRIPRMMWMY